MSRKIFEQQTIDIDTGEVKTIRKTIISKNNETFGMYRLTTGAEWILDFQGRELQLIMVLLHFEDMKTRIVPMSHLVRKSILELFKISSSTLSNMLRDMEDKGFLLKLSRNDLLLNPLYFYRGGSHDIKQRITDFNNEYDKIRNLRKSNKVNNLEV